MYIVLSLSLSLSLSLCPTRDEVGPAGVCVFREVGMDRLGLTAFKNIPGYEQLPRRGRGGLR